MQTLAPLHCVSCGYASGAMVCTECGAEQFGAADELLHSAQRSSLLIVMYGAVLVFVMGVSWLATGAPWMVFAAVLLLVGALACLAMSALLFRRRPVSLEEQGAMSRSLTGWNRGIVFASLPLLVGGLGASFHEWLFVRLGGSLNQYWQGAPLASEIGLWSKGAVFGVAVVACIGWALTMVRTYGAWRVRVQPRFVLRLVGPFLGLIALSVGGGLVLWRLADQR